MPSHERVISRSEGLAITGPLGGLDLVERMLGRNRGSYGKIMSKDWVRWCELVSVLDATQVTVPQRNVPAAFVLRQGEAVSQCAA